MFLLASDALAYLTPEDRRAWLALLVASVVRGISRSLFLAAVNGSILALSAGNLNFIYLIAPALLLCFDVAVEIYTDIQGQALAERVAARIRSRLASSICGADLRMIEREQASNIHYHFTTASWTLARSYPTLVSATAAAITLLGNLIYIGWLSRPALLVAVSVAAAGVAIDWLAEARNIEQRRMLHSTVGALHDSGWRLLRGFKELRLSAPKARDFLRQIDGIHADIQSQTVRVAKNSAAASGATHFFEYAAVALFATFFSLIAGLSAVVTMQLITAVLFSVAPLGAIVGAFPDLGRGRVAAVSLKRLFLALGERGKSLPPEQPRSAEFESLELKDAVFRFDGEGAPESESFVLGPMSLSIKRGEVVCFVGSNGSGKSVLMRLIAGLYPLSSGEILFNGSPLRASEMDAYRSNFTAVFTDFFLFRELLGQRDKAPQVVDELLGRLDIGDKTRLENGQFTTIDLSTGQRKRLALAVALLEERPILILDEFAAEQDPAHRDLFYSSYLPWMRQRGLTILIVSNDSIIPRDVDAIARLEFGKLVEFRRGGGD